MQVADVAMTTAGLASLVYLLDANFNFDRNASGDQPPDVELSLHFSVSISLSHTRVYDLSRCARA